MITVAAILAMPAVTVAQETHGRYATHDGKTMVQEMPDGSKVQLGHLEGCSERQFASACPGNAGRPGVVTLGLFRGPQNWRNDGRLRTAGNGIPIDSP